MAQTTDDPFYSEENMSRLRKSIEQMEKTGGTVHEVTLEAVELFSEEAKRTSTAECEE